MSHRALSIAVATALTLLTIGVGSALAAQQIISTPGPIDNIYLNDGLQCQATHVGDTHGEFFGGTNPGSCGTALSFGGTVYGFLGTAFTPVSQTPVTGAGTASNPYQVTTTVAAGSTGVQIVQTDSYVLGQEQYRTDVTVQNNSSGALFGTLYHAADCYLQGSDIGYGFVDSVGHGIYCSANANNSPPARVVGFVPITGGSSYDEGFYSTVYSHVTSTAAPFPNTCDCTILEDNGAGLSWPIAVNSGGSATISLSTVMSPTGGLGSAKPTVNTGAPSVQSSTSAGLSGSVNPGGLQTTAVFQYGLDPSYNGGGPLVYTNQVAASPSPVGSDSSLHSVSGSATGLAPNAKYHYRVVATNSAGTTFGSDQTFTTRRDASTPAPVLGKSVNMTPVSGRMYVKFPGSSSGGRLSSTGPGFVPCLETCHLPAGTQVDSRFGSFKLASASGQKGKTFTGTFGGAIVSVSQSKKGPDKGFTTFKLLLGAFPGAPNLKGCSTKTSRDGGPLAQTASLRSAYHSSSRGRYRTRGGRSSGSSSGTKWDTIVRCDGVLYKVFKGTVVVNDAARHKTVIVRAGQKYLAKR